MLCPVSKVSDHLDWTRTRPGHIRRSPWTWGVVPHPTTVRSSQMVGPGDITIPEASAACMRAKSFQSCLTLCDPMDCSPLGSSVHGILQARILE